MYTKMIDKMLQLGNDIDVDNPYKNQPHLPD